MFGGADFDDLAAVHEHDPVCHASGKAHLVRDHHHRHAGLCQLLHYLEHLTDHFRVQGGGRLVEEHDLGLHRQRSRDRHPLLLATRKLSRKFGGLLGDAHTLEQLHGACLRFGLFDLAHLYRGQGDVLQHGQVRKKVELLEDHAGLHADGLDVAHVVGQRDAVHNDLPALVFFEAVDRADKGGFARAGGPDDHHNLAAFDRQADIFERVEVAVPFVDLGGDNDVGILSVTCHSPYRFPKPSLLSSRRLAKLIP